MARVCVWYVIDGRPPFSLFLSCVFCSGAGQAQLDEEEGGAAAGAQQARGRRGDIQVGIL